MTISLNTALVQAQAQDSLTATVFENLEKLNGYTALELLESLPVEQVSKVAYDEMGLFSASLAVAKALDDWQLPLSKMDTAYALVAGMTDLQETKDVLHAQKTMWFGFGDGTWEKFAKSKIN